jgi:hypothetical protein
MLDNTTATALLEECLLCGYTVGAGEILDLMKGQGLWIRTSTLNSLMRYFRNTRDPQGALRLLKVARTVSSARPDAETYALAIQTCAWR